MGLLMIQGKFWIQKNLQWSPSNCSNTGKDTLEYEKLKQHRLPQLKLDVKPNNQRLINNGKIQ